MCIISDPCYRRLCGGVSQEPRKIEINWTPFSPWETNTIIDGNKQLPISTICNETRTKL